MRFKISKIKPVKSPPKGNFWLIAKVILINWTIFSLIVAVYALRQGSLRVKEMERRLDICQTNMEAITSQVDSSRIILDLKKK